MLATIDIVYVARDRISGIYLADAAVEIVVVVAWIVAARQQHRNPLPPSPGGTGLRINAGGL